MKWQAQTTLNQIIPEQITNTLDSLSGIIKSADEVLSFIEGILQIAEAFIQNPSDIITTFLKQYSQAIITAIQDALGLGGGFIVIHPWNRMNKRTVNISNDPKFPLHLPAMNGQEALNEFYASFNNQNDPYRPQWSTNTNVVGMGVLVIAPDVSVFLNVVSAIAEIANIKEFKDIVSKYSQDTITWYQDARKQAGEIASTFTPFDIKGLSNLDFKNITGISNNKSKVFNSSKPFNETLPSLHWYGLSLDNFVFFDQITKAFQLVIDKLLSLTSTTDNAIVAFINTLIKKIESLKELIDIIYNTAQSFLISLKSTGLYFFEVPQGSGGVNYVINSIKQSLNSPDTNDSAEVSKNLTTSNFSLLFFMGASTGVNLTAWKNLFINAFDATSQAAQKLNSLLSINYSVIPDFTNKVFYFEKPINLQVVSQDSSDQHQYYYTYTITDQSGVNISSFTNRVLGGNTLRVNKDKIPILLKNTKQSSSGSFTYTIEIKIFDFISPDMTYKTNFTVTDSISNITSVVTSSTPISISSSTPGTVTVSCNNRPIETKTILGGTTTTIGSLIAPFTDTKVTFTNSSGTFTTPILNNIGYIIGEVDNLPIPNSFRFPFFPGRLFFNFLGALKIRKKGEKDWIYLTLPGYLDIDGLAEYEYYIFTNETGWIGPFLFSIVNQTLLGTQVC